MKNKAKSGTVAVHLTEREFRRLQGLGFRAKRTGGRKLSASEILRALIRFMRHLEVDLKGVKSGAELTRRLRAARPRGRN